MTLLSRCVDRALPRVVWHDMVRGQQVQALHDPGQHVLRKRQMGVATVRKGLCGGGQLAVGTLPPHGACRSEQGCHSTTPCVCCEGVLAY